MTRVLIISSDIVDENMAGVGVRYWEIAHALAVECAVTLAIPNQTQLTSESVNLVSFDWQHGDLRDLARQADVIVIQGFTLHFHPYLRDLSTPLAVDLYVPNLLESLVWHDRDKWSSWVPAYEEYLRVQLELLRHGDFFFCASERQRDYWLGWLHAQKRINPHTFHADPSLRQLIDLVPFGLPNHALPPHQSALKGVHPGIPADSSLILWNGGLWDWLDPLTLIHAVSNLVPSRPNVRLVFLGTRHPNSIVSGMTMADRAIQLSRDLGLYENVVFFDNWVPYYKRSDYLQEADLAVITHFDHIETHFSFRTRILDCIWAGLPIVTSWGDAMADIVEKNHIGLTVPPGDIPALSGAIDRMLVTGKTSIQSETWDQLRQTLGWQNAVRPLLAFCRQPRRSPDQGLYLTELERISSAKDAFTNDCLSKLHQATGERDQLKNILNYYHSRLPFRIYHFLTRKVLRKKE